ncbi:MAG: zinc ribbon domain-containing protein, partial [Phycisphaeraceae bacterium]|nr:zinc ribbon domain-containing protein [Phycisphaeraceae bacterium]
MPTYEYQCQACGHELEAFQSITAGPLRKCPECGKLKLKRMIGTGGGVIFKGSGFWQTDYRSENYKSGAEKEKKATESAGSDGGKSDGKKTETSGSSDASKSDPKPKSTPDT